MPVQMELSVRTKCNSAITLFPFVYQTQHANIIFLPSHLALSLYPLLFNTFYWAPLQAGDDPFISEQEYRWIYTFVSVAAVPGAIVAPFVYKKLGVALTCVIANLVLGREPSVECAAWKHGAKPLGYNTPSYHVITSNCAYAN